MKIHEIVEYAMGDITALNDKAFSIEGMSSRYVRNLLNKAVSYPNSKYLEIGVWKGSTFYSALYNNSPSYSVAIDNFSAFGGPREEFHNNTKELAYDKFIDQDCFSVDISQFLDKFNVYFYDGEHSELDQEKAITHYYDALDDTFLYICDDYNVPHVQAGTQNGIKKMNLKILDEQTLLSRHNGDKSSWWNGIWIAYLQK
jgi:hypothetical protein